MARPTLLLGVFLIAVGATVGALALTETGTTGPSLVTRGPTPISSETFIRLMTRQRLVANDTRRGATPTKPNAATGASKPKASVKVDRAQEAAVPWPWNVSTN
jgi:hypothetical protein